MAERTTQVAAEVFAPSPVVHSTRASQVVAEVFGAGNSAQRVRSNQVAVEVFTPTAMRITQVVAEVFAPDPAVHGPRASQVVAEVFAAGADSGPDLPPTRRPTGSARWFSQLSMRSVLARRQRGT